MTKRDYLLSAALVSALFFHSAAYAEETSIIQDGVTDAVDDDGAEKIYVTGTRGEARSVADSPVPIDVFDTGSIDDVPFTDTNDVLQTLVPSFSLTRQPISDGATFVRPAALRGLPTDKTLVLVNSKRRHRAALVSIGGSGTQGPDIATIPTIALRSIEVLRDGAAAQYGSDAIAGVINFNLREDDSGVRLLSQFGRFYEGDGFDLLLAGNAGFSLWGKGFVNVSAEYTRADPTVRSEQYCEPWFCVEDYAAQPGNEIYRASFSRASIATEDVVQPWGRPESEAFRSFVNFGYTFSEAAEIYGFANYSFSTSNGSFFYRYPGNGTIEDLREPDGSIYSPLEIFPGGFTPRFFGDVYDYSGLGGLRGAFDFGFTYDVSGRVGYSEIQYTLKNTINPSLGPVTPTSFRPGDLINEEMQIQGDFTQEFEIGLASPVLFAFGASYLDESYEVVQGQEASYIDGPYALPDPWGFCNDDGTPTASGAAIADLNCADPNDPVYQVVGVGSNGFPGYPAAFSEVYERDSYAFYVDASADITEKLFVQAAGRYEDYSDFDDTVLIWKVAAQYDILDDLAVRASVGTGFRAPTPGQQGTTNVSTRLPNGFPVATGLFPASSVVAQALGATPLRPEESTNYAAGVVGSWFGVDFTVDYYRIELTDRVNAISTITIVDDCDTSTPEIEGECLGFRGRLIDAGVVGAESIGGVFYFTNAFDTVTQGVDFVATYTQDWDTYGTTDFAASVSYTQTEFDGNVNDLFNAEDRFDFENGLPNWRGVFTAKHALGNWDFLARLNYYGGYENSNGGGTITQIQEFSPEVLVDLEVSYMVQDLLRVSVGARNVFDNYPDEGEIGETCCGRIYRSDSIVDWQGGYYYLKLSSQF